MHLVYVTCHNYGVTLMVSGMIKGGALAMTFTHYVSSKFEAVLWYGWRSLVRLLRSSKGWKDAAPVVVHMDEGFANFGSQG